MSESAQLKHKMKQPHQKLIYCLVSALMGSRQKPIETFLRYILSIIIFFRFNIFRKLCLPIKIGFSDLVISACLKHMIVNSNRA